MMTKKHQNPIRVFLLMFLIAIFSCMGSIQATAQVVDIEDACKTPEVETLFTKKDQVPKEWVKFFKRKKLQIYYTSVVVNGYEHTPNEFVKLKFKNRKIDDIVFYENANDGGVVENTRINYVSSGYEFTDRDIPAKLRFSYIYRDDTGGGLDKTFHAEIDLYRTWMGDSFEYLTCADDTGSPGNNKGGGRGN